MKNKALLFAIIYSVLFITAICITFYMHYERWLSMVYLLGMAALLPFTILVIKTQRDTVHNGIISGRDAAKEGIKFVVISFIFLASFQAVFFYADFRQAKIDWTMKGEMQYAEQKINELKKNPKQTPEQKKKAIKDFIAKDAQTIAHKISMINLANEIFGVFVRTIMFGMFSAFVSALFLKRAHS